MQQLQSALVYAGASFRRIWMWLALACILASVGLGKFALATVALDAPIEVSEEAKHMCSNSVGLSTFSSTKAEWFASNALNEYKVFATCINGDYVVRTVKLEARIGGQQAASAPK